MRTRMGRLIAGAGMAAVVGAVGGAMQLQAATDTANLAVTAAVVSNCTITAGSVAFGNYDPVGANDTTDLDATGTVSVRCTKGTNATVGLDNGLNYSGTRRMSGGAGEFLGYELYSDAPGGTVWTDAATVAYVAPNRSPQDLTVYGRVPSAQDAAAGNYADTVVATITF